MPSPVRALGVLLCLCGVVPLHAMELVTLRTGFTLTCTSHEILSPEIIRLHLAASGTGGITYMDIAPAAIKSVEDLPDAPPPAQASALPAQPPIAKLLQTSGNAHNINVALLASVVQAESAGNPHAVSRRGAAGLMQLMSGTASQYKLNDRFSPEGNVNAGSAYLCDLLTRYHENLALALAAYNAGPAAVDRFQGVPPFHETQVYVARVIREFNRRVLAEQRASR